MKMFFAPSLLCACILDIALAQPKLILNKSSIVRTNKQPSALKTSSDGVDTAWVRRYKVDPPPWDDHATSMAVGNSGSVYIAGHRKIWEDYGDGSMFVLLKFNAKGTRQWIIETDASVQKLLCDSSEHIFVIGKNSIAKYDSQGTKIWNDSTTLFGSDWTCDRFGNTYVTGANLDSSGWWTAKYNSAGERLWLSKIPIGTWGQSFNGNSEVVLSQSGFIYIMTPLFINNDSSRIMRYSPSGELKWMKSNVSVGPISVDRVENVFIAQSNSDSGSYDIITAKYDSTGNRIWTDRYNGPNNRADRPVRLTLDEEGNAYVVGKSDSIADYKSAIVTIKYDPSGIRQWVSIYDSLSDNTPSGLAVDRSGSVYVSGKSMYRRFRGSYTLGVVLKYNSIGVQQWVDYQGTETIGMNLDNDGNAVVVGNAIGHGIPTTAPFAVYGFDMILSKFDNEGRQLLESRYDGLTNSYDEAKSLAVDQDGNAYVTGSIDGTRATVKYSPNGDTRWVRSGGGGEAIATDAQGNVYVGGTVWPKYVTIKYDQDGNTIWERSAETAGDFILKDLTLDQEQNVILVGSTNGHYTIVKYTKDGSLLWSQQRTGSDSSWVSITSLTVDANGFIYIAGEMYDQSLGRTFLTIKYTPAGDTAWARRHSGPGNGESGAFALVADNSGNVYVTGYVVVGPNDRDYFTVKYDSKGDELWARTYNGQGNTKDQASSIVSRPNGGVYVTGSSSTDGVIINYAANGDTIWTRRINGIGDPFFEQRGQLCPLSALDDAGDLYLAGAGAMVARLSADGGKAWISGATLNVSNANASPAAIKVNSLGEVFVAGSINGYFAWSDFFLIKYIQTATSVGDRASVVPSTFRLEQNYPNPFNPETKISYELPVASLVKLSVFDLLGREVAVLVNEEMHAGTYKATWDAAKMPSGVYFYRLTAGEFVETRKMVLLR